MGRVFLQRQVVDSGDWRPHFDANNPDRGAAGITDVAVLRDTEDPNSVCFDHDGVAALVTPMVQDLSWRGRCRLPSSSELHESGWSEGKRDLVAVSGVPEQWNYS